MFYKRFLQRKAGIYMKKSLPIIGVIVAVAAAVFGFIFKHNKN